MAGNPVKAIDDVVMKGVNNLVKGVNWVTGLSRTEQAQISSFGGYVYGAFSDFSNGRSATGMMQIGFGVTMFLIHGLYKRIEEREIEFMKQGVKIPRSPTYDFILGTIQYFDAYLGVSFLASHAADPTQGHDGFAMRNIGNGLAFAIHRADPAEPRKNCFARFMEKNKAYNAKPATEVN